MKLPKIDKTSATQAFIGFLGISSAFFTLFQVIVKDNSINEYVLVFCTVCFLIYFIITQQKNRSPLREIDEYFLLPNLDYEISHVKTKSELEQIVDLARNNYNCPINELDFKMPMWEKNEFCFFIVKDHTDDVKANINLLPLTEEAYKNLKSGIILESELTPNDILGNTEDDKEISRYMYVEGLLSKSEDGKTSDKNALILIGWNFEKIIANFSNDTSKLIFCGIGGSEEGDNLMRRLGFHVATPAKKRRDKYDFFIVEFSKLKQNLDNKTLVGTFKKIMSRN